MRKLYSFFNVFLVLVPILLGLFYIAGLNYYFGYLRSFGIPHGIFNIDFNQILYFGGAAVIMGIVSIWKYLLVLILLSAFIVWFGFRFDMSYPTLFIIMMIFIFIIPFSSRKGEVLGNNLKKSYIEKFNFENNKVDNDLFLLEFADKSQSEIGYIITSNETWIAFYTKHKGLVIERSSRMKEIRQYKTP